MRKKIIFITLLLVLSITHVNAMTYGGCDYSIVARLKKIVNNINLSYDYKMVNGMPNFSITINNVVEGMYFLDTNTGLKYYYKDTKNGEITINNYLGHSGAYKFYADLQNCSNVTLGSKYYDFPSYNYHYNSELCKEIPNFSLCKKWVSVNLTEDELKKEIEKYRNKGEVIEKEEPVSEFSLLNYIIELYTTYYYYIFIAIIFICGIIIIIKRRKDSFKL